MHACEYRHARLGIRVFRNIHCSMRLFVKFKKDTHNDVSLEEIGEGKQVDG